MWPLAVIVLDTPDLVFLTVPSWACHGWSGALGVWAAAAAAALESRQLLLLLMLLLLLLKRLCGE